MKFWEFSDNSYFQGSQVLKVVRQFVRQLIYTSFFLLIIKLRFTCGETKICSTIKRSQNIMNMITDNFLTFDIRRHPFSTYAKFFEKLTFLIPWYAHVGVHIKWKKVSYSEEFFVHTKRIVPYIPWTQEKNLNV